MNDVSIQVRYVSKELGPAVILIADTGSDDLARAKSRAKSLSETTGQKAHVVGQSSDGEDLGQITYADGKLEARSGCYA